MFDGAVNPKKYTVTVTFELKKWKNMGAHFFCKSIFVFCGRQNCVCTRV